MSAQDLVVVDPWYQDLVSPIEFVYYPLEIDDDEGEEEFTQEDPNPEVAVNAQRCSLRLRYPMLTDEELMIMMEDDEEEEFMEEDDPEEAVGSPDIDMSRSDRLYANFLQMFRPTATEEELRRMMAENTYAPEEDEGFPGVITFDEILNQNLRCRSIPEEDVEEICVVCQCEYQVEQTVGRLQCGHEFHAECIRKWVLQCNSCPLCKQKAIPQI